MSNTCVCCGDVIPEGGQVCRDCMEKPMNKQIEPIEINMTEEEQKRAGKVVSEFWLGMLGVGNHRFTEWLKEYCDHQTEKGGAE